MKRTKHIKRASGLFIGLLLMALFVFHSADFAFAACTPGTATGCDTATTNVGGGSLGLTTSNPGAIDVTLGSASSATLPITAIDNRGETTPSGWTVSLAMTQFANAGVSHTLDKNTTASLTALNVSCTAGTGSCSGLSTTSSCEITSAVPITSVDATTDGPPVKVCDTGFQPASLDQGLIQLNPTFTVTVPGTAIVDSYTSTITVTIATDVGS